MSPTEQHPTMAELRQLSTLRQMGRKALHELADRLRIQRALRGTVLLARGSADDHTLYLLKGRVRLTAEDGKVKELDHEDASAKDPIARLRPSHYEVLALSKVEFLRINNQLLDELNQQALESSTLLDYEVSEEPELQNIPADNRLMIRIYQDLNDNKLNLPSLPEVARGISHAMQDPSLDADRLAMIISADPAASAKLLQLANSSRISSENVVTTLSGAIKHLGLQHAHNMVVAFTMKDLFQTGSHTLQQHMQALWAHSRRVAAISHVLAMKLDAGFDPGLALLAGLLHDIGAIALLSYARQCPDLTQVETALDETIDKLKAQMGSAIIRSWHLPAELTTAAREAEHWDRDHDGPADHTDLVIVAQLHSFVGTKAMARYPRLDEVPAYRKLDLGRLTPKFSLQLLEDAAEEIHEIEALLHA